MGLYTTWRTQIQSTVFLTNYDSAGQGRGYKRETRVNTGVGVRVAEWKHGQTDGETTSLHIKRLGWGDVGEVECEWVLGR